MRSRRETLTRLALGGATLAAVAQRFGLHASTVGETVHRYCRRVNPAVYERGVEAARRRCLIPTGVNRPRLDYLRAHRDAFLPRESFGEALSTPVSEPTGARHCPTCGNSFTPRQAHYGECYPCWTKRQVSATRIAELEADNALLEQDNARLAERCAALEYTVHSLQAAVRQAQADANGSALPVEFSTMLSRLIQLCHPDRHGGSEAAQRATQWLLAQRARQRAEST